MLARVRQPETTDEHVPPLCLFPEQKDLDSGEDLRKNLITVAACPAHNLGKARDDEYLLWVLSTNLPANAVAMRQVVTKLTRAHLRRPALGLSLVEHAEDVIVMDSHSGVKHEAAQIPLDGQRFQRVLDLIALGIYYHHFEERWKGTVRVHADFIGFVDEPNLPEIDANRRVLFDCAQELFAAEAKHGDNPSVFTYQVHEPRDLCRCLIRFTFYGACTATAFLGERSASQSPPDAVSR